MRPNNQANMSALDASVNQSGLTIPADQVVAISAQAVVTGLSTGTLNIQMSNDPDSACTTDSTGKLQPTNWSNIATVGTVTLSGAGVFNIPKFDVCAKWLRGSYVKNNGSAGTVTVQIQTIAL
jgi:hypothetical protein